MAVIYQFLHKNNFLMSEKKREKVVTFISVQKILTYLRKKKVYAYCMLCAELQLTTGKGASCTTNIQAELHC